MQRHEIVPGSILEGPRWPEPVEVTQLESLGEYVRLVGVTQRSRLHVDQMIPAEEFRGLVAARAELDFRADPAHAFLALEGIRYRLASLYDPLLAVNTSKIDPLPHQIEAVYGFILDLPRIRFLIADDPGAGKTIMAGLVIKELKLRGLIRRILIVVPGHLRDQWRRELKDRFEEIFALVDRSSMNALYGENVWSREMQIITSIDFAKQDDVLPAIAAAHFDLVIVDEAHKMAAYRYGNKLEKTGRYRLGEVLSDRTEHFLFLTATPHRGDPENFRLFLDLLVPGMFATPEMLQESIQNKDNPLFIRRVKEDLRDFEGRPLFLPRHVRTRAYNLGVESPKEKDLYNALSVYVKEQYNKALVVDKRRNIAFALVILQRRLASSVYALYQSLLRRKKRLEEMKSLAEGPRPSPVASDWEAVEDMSEEERWKEEELWETLSVARNRQELESEIHTLEGLIEQAKAIIDQGEEAKLSEFKKALDELGQQFPDQKILIFTESRDTLDYLERRMRSWGYSVCTIHGAMRLEERVRAEATFKNEAQVMVATEAAGEGINLQFCHLMINFDLPWNPNRLEQRMGRIHRYGQTKEVYIFNLVAADTREGRVMKRLFDKLDEIRNALGSDKVFDVVGDVLEGKDLSQLMIAAAADARSIDEILSELEIQVDEAYLGRVRQKLGESLATRYIDYTRIQEMADLARENRLIPEYTEAFFKKALDESGGRWHTPGKKTEAADGLFTAVDSIPYEIRQIADEEAFKRRYGPIMRRYGMITFDKDVAQKVARAEFVSFGHPLFEAVLEWVERKLRPALSRGAVFRDPDGRLDGTILFFEGEVQDGRGETAGKRLFALFADRDGEKMRALSPAVLWDLAEEGEPEDRDIDVDALRNKARTELVHEMEAYRRELLHERERQAAVKEKYGVRSLEQLIVQLDGDLIRLHERREAGENVDLVIHNKEEQKRAYERALEDLRHGLEQDRSLTLSTPRFLGAAAVVPEHVVEADMESDPEIELVGMRVTMEYEASQGRVPEDVADQNLGFDVRSTDPATGAKRYIEVKARAGQGSVSLTQNEWFKARRFGLDYYLYVVLDAAESPRLFMIRDPANTLRPEESIEVRYRVGVDDIQAVGKLAVA